MAVWLLPISLFWCLAALYLGGAPIRIEGGGGGRQLAGLFLHFALFLAVWAGARAVLAALLGDTAAIILSALLAVILLPLLARLAFRIVGVRISSTEGQPEAAG
ncbi:MAG TPA: hypothetical protein VGA70_01080 [Longimicrobiales bacterium]